MCCWTHLCSPTHELQSVRVRVEIFEICVAKCYLMAVVARKIVKTIVAIKLNLAAFMLRIGKWMEKTRMD